VTRRSGVAFQHPTHLPHQSVVSGAQYLDAVFAQAQSAKARKSTKNCERGIQKLKRSRRRLGGWVKGWAKDMKNGYTTIILIESERPLSVYITNADSATAFGSADAINFAWPIYLCKAG